jgi:hypothetical protein
MEDRCFVPLCGPWILCGLTTQSVRGALLGDRAAVLLAANGKVVSARGSASGKVTVQLWTPFRETGVGRSSPRDRSPSRPAVLALYAPGDSLWRARIMHFTQPFDFNWSARLPADATPPNGDPTEGPPPCMDGCCGPVAGSGAGPGQPPNEVSGGSIVGCREQLLKETIPIAGTPFALHYSSDRVSGRRAEHQIQIPLSGSSIPASLLRIELEVDVGGRRFTSSHAPTPNLTVPFEWDGKDSFGRQLQGAQPARCTSAQLRLGRPAGTGFSPDGDAVARWG